MSCNCSLRCLPICYYCGKDARPKPMPWTKINTPSDLPADKTDVLIWNGICMAVSCRFEGCWAHDIDYYDYDNVTHYKYENPPKE